MNAVTIEPPEEFQSDEILQPNEPPADEMMVVDEQPPIPPPPIPPPRIITTMEELASALRNQINDQDRLNLIKLLL
jgi:hypothetical protein